jgi:hypothetical protein
LAVVSIVPSAVAGRDGKVPAIISSAHSLNASSVICSLVGVHDLVSNVILILLLFSGKYNSFTLLYCGFGLLHIHHGTLSSFIDSGMLS